MSKTNPISDGLQRVLRGVQSALKGAMDKVPHELSAFTGEFLRNDTTGRIKAKSGRLYYKHTNQTNRLRPLYNNLARAIKVGGKGNISDVTVAGNVVAVTQGIALNTTVRQGPRSGTLIYAAFHEKPGERPYLKPGMELFLKSPQGLAAIMRELETDLVELAS